jgi:hypothetical protein
MKHGKAALLCLTALALLATSALVASSAQGEPEPTHEFTCLQSDHGMLQHCLGHGVEAALHREHNEGFSGKHIFETEAGDVTCESVAFDVATDADGKSESTPTTPTYDECEALGLEAHVDTGDCQYKFYVEATTQTQDPPSGYEEDEGVGTSSLVCDQSTGITIELTTFFGTCHIEVTPQETIGPIYFRNKAEGQTDITVEAFEANVTGVHITGGLFKCGTSNGEYEATYTGNTTVQATIISVGDARFD